MKLRQVVNALPALQKIAGQDLSIKKLYQVSKLLGNLEKEIAFFNEQKERLFREYCEIDNGQYVPREELEAQFSQKLNELFNTDIDCEIKEVVIDGTDDVKLSYNDLIVLDGFISIEGDDD